MRKASTPWACFLLCILIKLPAIDASCDNTTHFLCPKSTKCIPRDLVCDLRKEDCHTRQNGRDDSDELGCTPQECKFDYDRCNYIAQAPSSGFQWRQGNPDRDGDGSLPMPPNKPFMSETYAWIERGDATVDSPLSTRIVSQPFGRLFAECHLLFSYWLGSSDPEAESSGELAVALVNDRLGYRKELWRTSQTNPSSWMEQVVNLGEMNGLSISFEAFRPRSNFSTGISIANLEMKDCELGHRPEEGRCKTDVYDEDEFRCRDRKQCIYGQYVCDKTRHCFDGSDEDFCSEHVFNCDFEQSSCSWINLIVNPGQVFTVAQAQQAVQAGTSGPAVDHTTSTDQGHYLFAHGDDYDTEYIFQAVSSEVMDGQKIECSFRFYYYSDNEILGNFYHIYNITEPMEYKHWFQFGNSYELGVWTRLMVEPRSSRNFLLALRVEHKGPNTFALDDLTFSPECARAADQSMGQINSGKPRYEVCENGSGDLKCGPTDEECFQEDQICDFEYDCANQSDEFLCSGPCAFDSNYCNWAHQPDADMDWLFTSGEDGHSLGTSNYLQVGPSVAASQNASTHIVYLESTKFSNSGSDCKLLFWYRLLSDGEQQPKLQVYARMGNIHHELVDLMVTKAWSRVVLEVHNHQNFQLVFKATPVSGSSSVISLDDINFDRCGQHITPVSCRQNEFFCANKSRCVLNEYRCDGKADCADKSDEQECRAIPGDCSFLGDLWKPEDCSWDYAAGEETVQNRWFPAKNESLTPDNYFLRASVHEEKFEANIRTSVLPPNKTSCFVRFWYFMYSNEHEDEGFTYHTHDQLKVGVEDETGLLMHKLSLSTNDPNEWKPMSVKLNVNRNFRVVFTAYQGQDLESMIGLDEVSFTPGCESPEEKQVCQTSDFQCPSPYSACLPENLLCNGRAECHLGEDEADCDRGDNNNNVALRIILPIFFCLLFAGIAVSVVLYRKKRLTDNSIPAR